MRRAGEGRLLTAEKSKGKAGKRGQGAPSGRRPRSPLGIPCPPLRAECHRFTRGATTPCIVIAWDTQAPRSRSTRTFTRSRRCSRRPRRSSTRSCFRRREGPWARNACRAMVPHTPGAASASPGVRRRGVRSYTSAFLAGVTARSRTGDDAPYVRGELGGRLRSVFSCSLSPFATRLRTTAA